MIVMARNRRRHLLNFYLTRPYCRFKRAFKDKQETLSTQNYLSHLTLTTEYLLTE